MKKLLASFAIVAGLMSCSEEKGPEYLMCRARCIESNTITYAKYSDKLMGIYQEGDTVWVNMLTHYIDDKDTTAQRCILTLK